MKPSPPRRDSAFTLIEGIFALGGVVILAALLLPALARAKAGSHGANCISNLHHVGVAWLTWAHDHEEFEFPFRVPVVLGGTMSSTNTLRNNAWWQFSVISNELDSPRPLVCPADKNVGQSRKIASNWSLIETNGGFISSGFRHRATSYTIGLDSGKLPTGRVWENGNRILGTDRNIQFDARIGRCSTGLNDTSSIRVRGKTGQNLPATAPWTNAIHGLTGNVLLMDGGVQKVDSKDLDALCELSDDNGSIHFLVPK